MDSAFPIRIIGIDPGSRITGWGVIEVAAGKSRCLAFGRVQCTQGAMPQRLLRILEALREVVGTHAPHEAAIEQVFVKRNVGSSLVLGQARGAALCALAGARLDIAEYAPAQIKLAIVGHGRAEKSQMQHMVKVLLDLQEAPPTDAADALAVALCHAHLRAALPSRAPRAARGSWRSAVVDAAGRLVKS